MVISGHREGRDLISFLLLEVLSILSLQVKELPG
jgi:hypothetical protein